MHEWRADPDSRRPNPRQRPPKAMTSLCSFSRAPNQPHQNVVHYRYSYSYWCTLYCTVVGVVGAPQYFAAAALAALLSAFPLRLIPYYCIGDAVSSAPPTMPSSTPRRLVHPESARDACKSTGGGGDSRRNFETLCVGRSTSFGVWCCGGGSAPSTTWEPQRALAGRNSSPSVANSLLSSTREH